MDKRQKKAFEKYRSPQSGYLLLYFEDGAYEILHSNHSLLPSGFDYEDVNIRSEIRMKPGFIGIVLAKSTSESDLKLYERRLSSRLDNGTPGFDDSFRFLDISSNRTNVSDTEAPQTPASASTVLLTNSDSETCEKQVGVEEEHTDQNDTINSENSQTIHDDVTIVSILKQQTAAIRKQLKVQEDILKETRAIKRFIKGKVDFPSNANVSPVIYNDTNIATLGHKNLDPSQFGLLLSRHLFTDEELKEKMLYPKRTSGRSALSPVRSQKFVEAVESRFCDEAVDEAIRSANSLGNDLKKGRRKRKTSK